MLASASRLTLSSPEPSPAKDLRMVELRDNGPEARRLHERGDRSLSRSIYLPLLRGVTPRTLEAFDPVQQALVTGQRDTTTVPTQALFLLNSGFVRQQSLALADRLLAQAERPEAELIQEAYVRTLGRSADEREVARAANYLAEFTSSYGELPAVEAVSAVQAANERSGETEEDSQSAAVADNPDDIDRTPQLVKEEAVQPKTAKEAAWMSFVQALYSSAEFRFVR
jgi:hypothetical protein